MSRSNVRTASTDSSLDQGEQRILRWLERYPFQRAQDLVVALSPWEGRGAVYRRIAELEAQNLIESVRLGTLPREHLYHLSPSGRYACATWRAEAGEQRQAPSLVLREEREKLVSLLPRLPIWFLIQDLINGLVRSAARALARAGTGEEASSVRWNWQREYRHAFMARGQTERVLNARADGALGLCLRFSDQREAWHTFLLLHCPLDDGRLLRNRLDRLMRWREARERQAAYGQIPQMPLVLILATSQRQAEWWQLASAQVVTRLRQEELLGAIAPLPEGGKIGNSWRLPWRQLGTDAPCHLQNLLHPSHAPALPELLETAISWPIVEPRGSSRQEAIRVAHVPPYTGKRAYALAASARKGSQAAFMLGEERDYRLASLFLTTRDMEVLSLLFAHPLLSRDELAILLGMHPKSAQMVLASLAQKGLIERNETPIGGRWHLTENGLRLLARRAACHVHHFVRSPVLPDIPLQQRGVAGLLHQIRHTAGVYSFFTDLVKSLATTPGTHLRWWETGAMCEHVFTYREQTYHFKPDALAAVQFGTHQLRFWLEWDRGTMGVQDLERKCATYAAYLSSREWARGGAHPPALLYVAPEIAQERRFQKTACALLAHLPGFRLSTTTASLLALYGVLAPVYQPVALQASHAVPPEHVARVALFAQE